MLSPMRRSILYLADARLLIFFSGFSQAFEFGCGRQGPGRPRTIVSEALKSTHARTRLSLGNIWLSCIYSTGGSEETSALFTAPVGQNLKDQRQNADDQAQKGDRIAMSVHRSASPQCLATLSRRLGR